MTSAQTGAEVPGQLHRLGRWKLGTLSFVVWRLAVAVVLPPYSMMAPHAGFDTEQILDKARKDILYILEGVS